MEITVQRNGFGNIGNQIFTAQLVYYTAESGLTEKNQAENHFLTFIEFIPSQ